MNFMVPVQRKTTLPSSTYLYGDEMPSWLKGLVKFQYFLHYFKGEMRRLPIDLLKEVHESTVLGQDSSENVLYISKIPKDAGHEDLNKEWIRKRILGLANDHHARILHPESDLVFVDEDENHLAAVLFIDSFNYMRAETGPSEHPEDKQAIPGEDDDITLEKAQKEPEEELMPSFWNCPFCTAENDLNNSNCNLCESPRPPMDKIMTDFKNSLAESSKEDQSPVEEKPDEVTPNLEQL